MNVQDLKRHAKETLLPDAKLRNYGRVLKAISKYPAYVTPNRFLPDFQRWLLKGQREYSMVLPSGCADEHSLHILLLMGLVDQYSSDAEGAPITRYAINDNGSRFAKTL